MTVTVALQTAALNLSGLDFMGAIDPTYGFRIQALGDNFETGDPEAVIASIQSQLADGDPERIDRFGNRSATIPLMIDAPNSAAPGDAIAHGQAAVDAACAKASPLTGWTTMSFTSLLAGAQTTVTEVVSATVSKPFDDVTEMRLAARYITITIHARPFVRPVNPVTIAAIAGSSTTTVDDGTATTNWSLLTAQPANGTNLETNPSFETNATSWSAGTGTSAISTSTAVGAVVGSQALKASPSAVGGSVVQSAAIAATAAATYTVTWSCYTQSYSDGISTYFPTRTASVQFYSDAGGTVAVGSPVGFSGSAVTGWVQSSMTATAPAGAVSMRFSPSTFTPRTGTLNPWYLDAVSVTLSSWAGGYFDGASTSGTAVAFAWTGTAHASTSTATVTDRTLAVVSGMVKGTIYSSNVAAIRRTGAVVMTTLPYMKIVGIATINGAGSGLTMSVGDGGTDVSSSIISSSVNPTTGAFTIVLNRAAGFATSVDVTATYSGAFAAANITTIAIDSIVITDNPWGNGAIKTQTLSVLGSQRTELSLLLQGLDAPGTTAVPLGNEVLVYSAVAGTDGRSKFGSARAFASRAGTADATAISGSFDTLGTTAAPTEFTFLSSLLLPGNYLIYARIKAPTATTGDLLSYRAKVTPAVGDPVFDPRTNWKTAPITAVAASAVWPQVNTATWTMIPLGMLRLPPADVQDATANITIQVAKGSTAVTLDDLILCNADVGQASLVLTGTSGGSYSAVRLDAATLASPQALAWVGAANGAMVADASRWFGEQHLASSGILQLGTVTPNCTTTRTSGTYYPKYSHDVASLT